jgi:hypothetical protein
MANIKPIGWVIVSRDGFAFTFTMRRLQRDAWEALIESRANAKRLGYRAERVYVRGAR